MKKSILMAPIVHKETELIFYKLLAQRFGIDEDLIMAMHYYFSNVSIRPEARYDLMFVLNMFNGQTIRFPTIDEQYELRRDAEVYLEYKWRNAHIREEGGAYRDNYYLGVVKEELPPDEANPKPRIVSKAVYGDFSAHLMADFRLDRLTADQIYVRVKIIVEGTSNA